MHRVTIILLQYVQHVYLSYMGQSAAYPSSMELKTYAGKPFMVINRLSLTMFKGRIRSDIDRYRNRTKNLYFDALSIPSFTGFSLVNMNIGTMDNQGWEVAVWTVPYRNKNVTIGFDFNFHAIRISSASISEFYPNNKGNVGVNGDYLRLLQVDNPLALLWLQIQRCICYQSGYRSNRCQWQTHYRAQ